MAQGFTGLNIFSGNLQFGDSPNIDAFSRLRVSQPVTLFQTQTQYDADSLQLEGGATGTGVAPAQNANTRMVLLSATAGTGVSFLQSYEYIPYQPGKSQLVFITGMLDTAVAAVVKEIGLFDANNGIFFRQNGASGLQFVRRTKTSGSVVDNAVEQASWNLDTLDGNGSSGYTLDVTKVFILVIDLQFLAMGRIRIGFDLGGVIVYAHQFLNANIIATPYMQTASLPIQALLNSTASGSTANLYFKCASVISEGGFDSDLGQGVSSPEGTVTAGSGARTHILSVRPLTTFNSLANRTKWLLDAINILVTGNNPVLWELCIGCTFSVNPTYANVNSTYSAFEYGTGGTITAPALVVASGYVAASNQAKGQIGSQVSSRLVCTLDRAGAVRANGTISLLVSGVGGTSATRATLNWKEIR